MYREDLIDDLTRLVKTNHPDISTGTVRDIVSTVISSNLTKEFLCYDNNLGVIMDNLTAFIDNVDNIRNILKDYILSNQCNNVSQINVPQIDSGINVSIDNSFVTTFDEYDANLHKEQEDVQNQITTGPIILFDNIKSFVTKMQESIESEFSQKGSKIRGITYITNGIYMACCKYWKISYTNVIQGFKKRKIEGFETKGFLPLLAYYYMSGIKGGTYQPGYSKGDNTSYKLIPEDMIAKYESIMINNINNFLIPNLPDSYKIDMSSLEDFMKYFNKVFIATDDMSNAMNIYRRDA